MSEMTTAKCRMTKEVQMTKGRIRFPASPGRFVPRTSSFFPPSSASTDPAGSVEAIARMRQWRPTWNYCH
jgi:hypothetical protein